MKLLTLFFTGFLLLSAFISNAQTFEWAVRSGGNTYDYLNDLERDDQGYLYAIGQSSPNSEFGTITTTLGGTFFAKLDSIGNFLFVKVFDSIHCRHIQINDYNQILITGTIYGSQLDGTPVISPSGSSSTGFAALYDINGNQLWAQFFDNDSHIIASDNFPGGSFVIAGNAPSGAIIGSNTFSNSLPESFIAIIDTSGIFTMVELVATEPSDDLQVVSDPFGYIYIQGGYSNTTTLSNGQVLASPIGGLGNYIARCEPNGSIMWAKQISNLSNMSSMDNIASMDILSNNNLAFTGQFLDSLMIDNVTLSTPPNKTMTYVATFDTSGNLIWIFSDLIDGPVLLKSVEANGFYLTGSPMTPLPPYSIAGLSFTVIPGHAAMYLMQFDNSGNPQWVEVINTHHLGGHCCQSIRGLVKGSGNDLYLAGYYNGETLFDLISLSCIQNQVGTICSPYEMFVAKLGNIPTGVSFEMKESLPPEIYPNPTSRLLQINFQTTISTTLSIQLFDIAGRNVMNQTVDTKESGIDIQGLNDGIYFLHLTTGNHSFQKKIVKIRNTD